MIIILFTIINRNKIISQERIISHTNSSTNETKKNYNSPIRLPIRYSIPTSAPMRPNNKGSR